MTAKQTTLPADVAALMTTQLLIIDALAAHGVLDKQALAANIDHTRHSIGEDTAGAACMRDTLALIGGYITAGGLPARTNTIEKG